jgi:hypothetical protein
MSGPKLTKWWDNCLATEPAFRKVHGEIIKGLQVRRHLRKWPSAVYLFFS